MDTYLGKKVLAIQESKTVIELSYIIWTKEFEKAIGSSRQPYRDCFVEWVDTYKQDREPNLWNSYKKPQEVAEAIWPKYLDRDDDRVYFDMLRNALINWIINYKQNG